jgi:hypothetical protein
MNNTITGALEFFAFVTILAAGAFLWFATPAHAFIYRGETGETCYQQSDGQGGTYWNCSR